MHKWLTASRLLVSHSFASLRQEWTKNLSFAASIALGCVVLLIVGGYQAWITKGLAESLIYSQYAHLQISQQGFSQVRTSDPFSKPLDSLESIQASIERMAREKRIPALEVMATRQYALATAVNPANGKNSVVEVRGVNPEAERNIFLYTTGKTGNWLTNQDHLQCQTGRILANKLGLETGDRLIINGVDSEEYHNALNSTVKVIAGSYSSDFDSMVLSLTHNDFNELFYFDNVQELALLFEEADNLEEIRMDILTALHDEGHEVDVQIWYEQADYFRQVLDYYRGFNRMILGMAGILVFFVCMTTASLSLEERRREFGTRRALGETRSHLALQTAVETGIVALAGFTGGLILAGILRFLINSTGGIPMEAAPGMATSLSVHIIHNPAALRQAALVAMAVPPVALVSPLYRSLKTSIISQLSCP